MATTKQDLLAALDPAYLEFARSRTAAWDRLLDMVRTALAQGWKPDRFVNNVQKLQSFQNWQSQATEGEEVPGEEEATEPEEPLPSPPQPGATYNGDGTWTLPNGAVVNQGGSLLGGSNLLADLTNFLTENELPSTLINFIRDALANNKPAGQVIAELRQTPEYKAAYPENDMRSEKGLSWMPEAQIRAYRDEAKRLAYDYLGHDASNTEVAELIGRGTSLRQWEHRLQINQLVERWGSAVQAVFEGYTGSPLSEAQLHAFMDPNFATPDIDRLYEQAQRRGRPAAVGFGIRPEEEATLLEQFGLDPNRVFENYRTVAGQLPRFERYAKIAEYVGQGTGSELFGDVSVPGSLLFRAVQLGDPAAMLELQRLGRSETVRFQAGGGPTKGAGGTLGLTGLRQSRQ